MMWTTHPSILMYAALLSVSLTISWLLTPRAGRWAASRGLVAVPGGRHPHPAPKPKGGGIAIFVAFAASALSLLPRTPELFIILLGGLGMLLVGLIDDKRPLKPSVKLLGQVMVAASVVAVGPRIEVLSNPFGEMLHLGVWGFPLSILWIVALVNMLNLMDGLDGLAAGVSTIACVPLFVVALQQGELFAAGLTMALVGSSVGFLRYNFDPARLFMGDAGSHFLGYMLSMISMTGLLKGATAVAVAVPLIALGLPLLDTTCAIVRRVGDGRPVGRADAGHVHHRLLALGMSVRQAVWLLYGVSAVMAIASLLVGSLNPLIVAATLAVASASLLSIAYRLGMIGPLSHGAPASRTEWTGRDGKAVQPPHNLSG